MGSNGIALKLMGQDRSRSDSFFPFFYIFFFFSNVVYTEPKVLFSGRQEGREGENKEEMERAVVAAGTGGEKEAQPQRGVNK